MLDLVSSLPADLQESVMRTAMEPYFLPLVSLPSAWVLTLLPHFGKVGLRVYNEKLKYNNDTPRTEDLKSKSFGKTMLRLEGAHQNGLEMYPLFAAAVISGMVRKANPSELAEASVTYLRLRMIYTLLYLFGVNKLINLGRTVVWSMMIQHLLKMFFIARK